MIVNNIIYTVKSFQVTILSFYVVFFLRGRGENGLWLGRMDVV